MACYISSNDNRFYVAAEASYGVVPTVADRDRFPAVRLSARHELEKPSRRDKTGSRTFAGIPAGLRKRTSFELVTYMTGWTNQTTEPGYGPLFRGAMGGGPLFFGGGTLQTVVSPTQLRFTVNHGLSVGQAITFGGELRFVAAIVDAQTVILNSAFVTTPVVGSSIGKTVTYFPANDLVSVSLFDYWSPSASVHRILTGAAVDRMRVSVNGDFHEFSFSGLASDLLDSSSFMTSQGGLTSFPAEPALTSFNTTLVPGNLGQAWLGSVAQQFFTITSAELLLDNGLDLRSREFGSDAPKCISPGLRSVLADFSLYGNTDAATKGLYQAARQRSPLSIMFQLGQQAAQLCGVYLKSVVPEVPEFQDDESRLRWRFQSCRAQGTIDDEIYIAFG